ncbi:hypothetical protein ACIQW9_11410 [Herminiimonas sp. NPDC097707]|uniref:hypothetical protein n=1 Tax=Herminiimonas sp. NPDC097707 TaxID=3364007 RepID=UPI00383B790B
MKVPALHMGNGRAMLCLTHPFVRDDLGSKQQIHYKSNAWEFLLLAAGIGGICAAVKSRVTFETFETRE